MMLQRLLPPSEAARYLGQDPKAGPGWLAKARVNGSGPTFVKLGGRIFYDREDLDRWIDANKRRSTSEAFDSSQR